MGNLDLIVVGAGPAGVAAAVEAHAFGLDVALVDRATFPRDKTCGDGLTTAALRELERLGVSVPDLASYSLVRESVVASPSGRRVALPLPTGGHYAAVVRRHELDATLVERARAVGVRVREHASLDDLTEQVDGVVAHLHDGTTLTARHVVAADGHYSTTRRLLHPELPVDLGTWHAARQYYRGVDDPRLFVLFARELLPGYAWVFPLPDGRANVGFGVLRSTRRWWSGPSRDGRQLHELWAQVVAHPLVREAIGPAAEPEGPSRAWPIPCAYAPSRLADRRVLFAGDAAAVVDPMTGEGIAQALVTGRLAARAVANGGGPADVRSAYRRSVDRVVGRDLRLAARLQHVLCSPLGARAAVRIAGLSAWTRHNFARWMFEDYPRALVFTPDRWRRGAFAGHGAFCEAG